MSAATRGSTSPEIRRVQERYRWLAPIYPLFEPVLALPLSARRRAADALGLRFGDRVLEVGCGTGRNLPYLVDRVGAAGQVYGVDVTSAMLAVARRTVENRGCQNVVLWEGDAAQFAGGAAFDAVLFSLSYSVIPDPQATLAHIWSSLRPGGRVVVLDGALEPTRLGPLVRPFAALANRWTVLGRVDRRPWEDLRRLSPVVDVERFLGGIYFLATATKVASAGAVSRTS